MAIPRVEARDFYPEWIGILCVVREWTDDSRRGTDSTAHKMNWMKPLGHRGSPLEDWKVSERLGRSGGPTGRSRRAFGTWQ